MNIAVLGNGGFGTAMAVSLARGAHRVALWGHDALYTQEIARTRRNPRYLEEVVLPDSVLVTAEGGAALDGAELVLVAVPTQHVRRVLESLRAALPVGVPMVSLAKGLEQATGLRPTEVIREVLGPAAPVAALSGPSHAEEIARDLPTTVVVASPAEALVRQLQAALTTRTFRVYRHTDVLGLELCGALKNVMALAAGIADGLGYGDNAKAAILARGIVEMARYGQALGADLRTFHGLAGVGDLAVTAFSRHGRNRAFGERIGRGATLAEALA
ncbi:MAG: NAD(P)-dependent glycerol-3-phosphate dehydrogenase, partial [Planctomycetes bacterium]|nr:NAD(P)-dependent glycerol-3-phosphate dehydrogenase [Planctomycetota bacterium]